MKRFRRGLALSTLGMTLVAFSSAAIAAERVELRKHGDGCELSADLSIQLRAELEAAEFDVVESTQSDLPPDDAGTEGRLALVSCAPEDAPAISIWMARAGGVTERRVRAAPEESTHSLVLRVTELLRAHVVEVAAPPRAKPSTEPLPAVTSEPASHSYSVDVGASALLHPGGLSFSVAPALALGLRVTGPLWLELRAAGPFWGSERGGAGRADVDQELALLGARFVMLDGVASVFVSAALGAFRLGARGEARPPFQSLKNSALTAAFAAGAGTSIDIASAGGVSFGLGARAEAVLLTPEPALRLAENAVATAGQPACSFLVAVGARW